MKRSVAVLVTLLLLVVPVLTQESKRAAAIYSLDGIGIGTSLEDAHSMLNRLGTGGGRDTREGGRKESWTLKDTNFASVAFKTDGKGKVVWVSAFVRPGKELPFEKLGDVTKAATLTRTLAIWNVSAAPEGYRLVAKGAEGKATVVYLLSLELPPMQ